MNRTFSGPLSADKIKAIRERWPGKLVVKGIVTPEDAELALQLGADGLIVSNHGGRQLDAGDSIIGPASQGDFSINLNPSLPGAINKITVSGIISETGGARTLLKAGACVLTLSGSNFYTGATTLNDGTLKLGANEVVPNASAVTIAKGILEVNGKTETVLSLALALGAAATMVAGNTGTVQDTATGGSFILNGNVTYNAGAGGSAQALGGRLHLLHRRPRRSQRRYLFPQRTPRATRGCHLSSERGHYCPHRQTSGQECPPLCSQPFALCSA